MNHFHKAAATFGLLSISLAPLTRAETANKETVMKTDQPIQVQNIVLEPGEHVFKLTQPNSDETIVSIYNADQTHLEGLIIGMPAQRQEIDDKLFAVSQPEGNQPAVLQDWYFPGDNNGVEFRTAAMPANVAHASKSKRNQPSAGPSENATH